ncbi:Palmitoyltransferase akr1 [Thelohanellus kitauei]|uniref:Palmitoyltransferase akr1 n=1 Tax=Thelohanellus kitauei TaxID=669202 RepID=A0A0C2MZY2_THEKT|nr:Palmitoyltransferase akr1 [Thelohanellus kitauei]
MSCADHPGTCPIDHQAQAPDSNYVAHIGNLKSASIFKLVSLCDLETVENMSKNSGFEIFDQFDSDGLHILHHAARNMRVQVFIFIITHGVREVADKIVALSEIEDKSVIKLDIGVRSRNKDGSAPIHEATKYGNLALVEILLNLGTPIDITDNHLKTPIIIATQNLRIPLVLFLVSRGANINAEDEELDNCLGWASYRGSPELINIFLYLGLDINKVDSFIQTPTHLVCGSGNLEALKELIKKGRTALDVANEKGFTRGSHYLAYHMGKRGIRERMVQSWTQFTFVRLYVLLFFCYSILNFSGSLFYPWSTFFSAGSLFHNIIYLLLLTGVMYYGRVCWKFITYQEDHRNDYQNIFLQVFTATSLTEFLNNHNVCHVCRCVSDTNTIHCVFTGKCVNNFVDYDILLNNNVTVRNRLFFTKFYCLFMCYYILNSYSFLYDRRFILFVFGYLWTTTYAIVKFVLALFGYFGSPTLESVYLAIIRYLTPQK